jgi:hypothetical protein
MKAFFFVIVLLAARFSNAYVLSEQKAAFGGFFVRLQGAENCLTPNFLNQQCSCPLGTVGSTVVVVSSVGTLEWTMCVNVDAATFHDADFGGAFQCLHAGQSQQCLCTAPNPVTGNCTCPPTGEFNELTFDAISSISSHIAAPLTICRRSEGNPHSPLGRICGSDCQCERGYDSLTLPGQILLTNNSTSNATVCIRACSDLNISTCNATNFASYCGTCQAGSTCFNRNNEFCCDGELLCDESQECSRDWQGTLQCCPGGMLACFPGTCYNASAESCCLTIPGSWGQTCGLTEECCATQVGTNCCPQGTTCWTDGASLSTCVPSGMMACNDGEQAWPCPTNTVCGSNALMCLASCASTNCQLNATCCQGPDENFCCGSNTTCISNQNYGAQCSLTEPSQQMCSFGGYYWACPSTARCSPTDVDGCLPN